MQFKINGELVDAPENIRVREMAEAEQALNCNAEEAGMAMKMALALYIALRRKDPDMNRGLLADQVLDMDLSGFETIEDADPLEGQPVEAPPDPAKQQISGHHRLEALG